MSFTAKRYAHAGLLAALAAGSAAAANYAAETEALKGSQKNDLVLHEVQTGLAAIQEGNDGAATHYFDVALNAIENVFSNNDAAQKARSVWYAEGSKDFKGEPYERAMTYYYRGLMYLASGDPENARAMYRNAVIQSSFADETSYQSGFAALMFMEGWCDYLAGAADQMQDRWTEVKKFRGDWTPPGPADNVLVIAELGGAPRKVADGIDLHEIKYFPPRPATSTERFIKLHVGPAVVPLYFFDDLYWQASHRGPRAIDKIIDGKVSYKETTEGVGDVLTAGATTAQTFSNIAGGGSNGVIAGIGALGAISSLVSLNMNTHADVRYWANLPETLHVATFQADGPLDRFAIEVTDGKNQPVAVPKPWVRRWQDAKGRQVLWIKTRG